MAKKRKKIKAQFMVLETMPETVDHKQLVARLRKMCQDVPTDCYDCLG